MNARNRAEWHENSRFPPSRVNFARSVPSLQVEILSAYALSLRSKTRALAAATCCARQRALQQCSRSLNILTAHEPLGRSSRHLLPLLALHRMALTRKRKNPSKIAREIEIFSNFALSVPTLVQEHNSRFERFAAQCLDRDDRLIFNIWSKENHNFLVECYFCPLLRNRSKFEYVAFR